MVCRESGIKYEKAIVMPEGRGFYSRKWCGREAVIAEIAIRFQF
jgi:hypothetical protein